MLADLLNQPAHPLHLGRNTDQTAEAGPRARLLAQNPIFLVNFQHSDDAVELGTELRTVKRLGNVVGGSVPRGFHGAVDRALLRAHDHRSLRVSLPNSFQQFQSPKLGNAQVGDHIVYAGLLEDFRSLLGSRGGASAPAGIGHHIKAHVS